MEEQRIRPEEYVSVRAGVVSRLRELGLSSYGARAFVAILEGQPVSATKICKNTEIPDSKIYYALKELEDKKLIIAQRSTPSVYRTSSSKRILAGLERSIVEDCNTKVESVRKLESTLEPLARTTSNAEDVDLAYIVKGFKSIAEKMKELITDATKEIVFMAADEKLIQNLAEALIEAKNDRGLSLKIAVPEKFSNQKGTSLRLKATRSLLCKCNVLLADSERLVSAELSDSELQYGIVTQNKGMITLMRKSFDNPSCCC